MMTRSSNFLGGGSATSSGSKAAASEGVTMSTHISMVPWGLLLVGTKRERVSMKGTA